MAPTAPRGRGVYLIWTIKMQYGRGPPRLDGGLPQPSKFYQHLLEAAPHGWGSAGFSQSTGPPVAGRPARTGVCRRGQLLLHIEVRPPRMDGGLPTLRRVDRLGMRAAPHG